MRFLLPALLLALAPQDDAVDDVRGALKSAGDQGYAFSVEGRYTRTGVCDSKGLLVSHIKSYSSAVYKTRMLYKGPAGLWKKFGEVMGEEMENPDSEAKDILETLTSAQQPHQMITELLKMVKSGTKEKRTPKIGIGKKKITCEVYTLKFDKDKLKEYLNARIAKASNENRMNKPDEIYWSSLRGTLRVYLNKKNGDLVRVADNRSVRIAYKGSGAVDGRTYKVDISFDFSELGKARAVVPDRVKERLGVPK